MCLATHHTDNTIECQHNLIQELVEQCDHEYYLSALAPPVGNRERAERGRARITASMERLKMLAEELECSACHDEIATQIALQGDALLEIERVWQI